MQAPGPSQSARPRRRRPQAVPRRPRTQPRHRPRTGTPSAMRTLGSNREPHARFAENVFYQYFAHHGANTMSVKSPTTHTFFGVTCSSSSGTIDCTTDRGGQIRFSQSSISTRTHRPKPIVTPLRTTWGAESPRRVGIRSFDAAGSELIPGELSTRTEMPLSTPAPTSSRRSVRRLCRRSEGTGPAPDQGSDGACAGRERCRPARDHYPAAAAIERWPALEQQASCASGSPRSPHAISSARRAQPTYLWLVAHRARLSTRPRAHAPHRLDLAVLPRGLLRRVRLAGWDTGARR